MFSIKIRTRANFIPLKLKVITEMCENLACSDLKNFNTLNIFSVGSTVSKDFFNKKNPEALFSSKAKFSFVIIDLTGMNVLQLYFQQH